MELLFNFKVRHIQFDDVNYNYDDYKLLLKYYNIDLTPHDTFHVKYLKYKNKYLKLKNKKN